MKKITPDDLKGRKVIAAKQDKDQAKQLRDGLYEALAGYVKQHNATTDKSQGIIIKKTHGKKKPAPCFGIELRIYNKLFAKNEYANIQHQIKASQHVLALAVPYLKDNAAIFYKMKTGATYVWSDMPLITPEQEIVSLPTFYFSRTPVMHGDRQGTTHSYMVTFYFDDTL